MLGIGCDLDRPNDLVVYDLFKEGDTLDWVPNLHLYELLDCVLQYGWFGEFSTPLVRFVSDAWKVDFHHRKGDHGSVLHVWSCGRESWGWRRVRRWQRGRGRKWRTWRRWLVGIWTLRRWSARRWPFWWGWVHWRFWRSSCDRSSQFCDLKLMISFCVVNSGWNSNHGD